MSRVSKGVSQALFSLLVILLPTQLMYHMWPEWSLVLGRRIDYLSPSLSVTDILSLGVLFFWLVRADILFFRKLISQYADVCIVIIATLTINVIFSQNPPVSAIYVLRVICLFGISMYVWNTKQRMADIAALSFVGMVYVAFFALYQSFFQHSVNGIGWFLGERSYSQFTHAIAKIHYCFPFSSSCSEWIRPYATFSHPNVLGGYGAFLLPIFLSRLVCGEKGRTMHIVGCILAVLLVVLSMSRLALLATVLSLMVFFVRKKHTGYFIGAVAVVIIACTVLLYRFFRDGGMEATAIVDRVILVVASIRMFIEHWMTGVGANAYISMLPLYVPSSFRFLQPVHSLYVLFLSEWGLLGVSAGVWSVWRMRKEIGKAVVSLIASKKLAYGTPLLGVLLIGLADHYAVTLPQIRLLVAVYIGVWLANR